MNKETVVNKVKVVRKTVFRGFPVFALGAVTLLILKLCGIGFFSWLWIPAVLFAPFIIFFSCILVGISALIAVALIIGMIFLIAMAWNKIFIKK